MEDLNIKIDAQLQKLLKISDGLSDGMRAIMQCCNMEEEMCKEYDYIPDSDFYYNSIEALHEMKQNIDRKIISIIKGSLKMR